MTFGALETGSKSDDFNGFPGEAEAEEPWPVGAIWLLPGPHCSNQIGWNSFSTCKTQYQTCGNEGQRKNKDAYFENTKNQGCNIISFTQRNWDTGYRLEEIGLQAILRGISLLSAI